MDTSKEYIRMSRMALKVGGYKKYLDAKYDSLLPLFLYDDKLERVSIEIWCPKTLRDRLNQKGETHIISIERSNDGGIYIPEGKYSGVVPLLRQDQLQEMVKPKEYNDLWCVHAMACFVNQDNAGNLTGNPSMEQLWLAFVMHEKYGKRWNGEDWETHNKRGGDG